jgi:bifunctional non-homologous end joining protein LigD
MIRRRPPPPSASRATPRFIEPMTARLVPQLPSGGEWIYEVKFDGYRALIVKDGVSVQIRSRNDNDLTATYPGIEAAARRLAVESTVLDGEIVAVDAQGRPSFQALQHRRGFAGYVPVFYAFDLLHVDGEELTRRPLEERRALLPSLLEGSGILMSESLSGSVDEIIAAVGGLGLEGVIAKRRDSTYNAGLRASAWLKLKLDRQQELVIGGYRPGGHGIDALVVGYYEGRELRFAGKVRAGFTPVVRRELFATLQPLAADRCPFADLPSVKTGRWEGGITAEQMHEMRWVRPSLVAQVRFVEFTADGRLRHPSFLGLRTDKRPKDVRREY